MDNIFYELIKYMTTYNYSSSLAIPLKLMGNLKGTSLPAVYASLASFRNEAKICQTTTCNMPQPQYLYHCYTMHVLRNTDYGSEAHRNPNVEQIPIMYNFYNSDGDYIGKMLDEFGLINMNGRCYDPVVGRFLSPDILVQNPNNTQCYNRYSYAINNPLKYSDPSGWSWTPIQAANHANMMAMTMTMRLQDNFQPSVIRSGSSSRGNGFLFGSNAIVFQNAEATLQMELAAIDNMLKSVFGMPGLFGNPKKTLGWDYDKIESNYERDGQSILKSQKCLSDFIKDGTTNTCAIKLSYALNLSGYKIPKNKDAPTGVDVFNGEPGDAGNFILSAEDMKTYLSSIANPSYSFENISSIEDVKKVIGDLHKDYDDLGGIMVLVAGDRSEYGGSSGHADLLYEDFMWDISMYGKYGDDLYPYLNNRLNAKLSIYIWILKYD